MIPMKFDGVTFRHKIDCNDMAKEKEYYNSVSTEENGSEPRVLNLESQESWALP